MITRASRSESKRHELSSSSRSLPLNDSIQAFCHGDPDQTLKNVLGRSADHIKDVIWQPRSDN
jgi:molybdopterin-guanine dinucleotide biosynthesis protein